MNIITTVMATGIIGLLAATLLVIASKLMYVKVDPLIAKLRDELPGANCGACGFSGCDGYAAALAKKETTPDQCPPGGEETYKKLSELLGVDAEGGIAKKTAIIYCVGDKESISEKMGYDGIGTCFAAEQMYGGAGSCSFGCLGFGDCAKVCPSAAICITNGIAHVDTRKCGGCGLCVNACPRNVIEVENEPVRAVAHCRNTEKGAVVRKKCTKGCIACMKCVRECPAGAIQINDNLAVIDNSKCDGCGHCADICMTKCIRCYV